MHPFVYLNMTGETISSEKRNATGEQVAYPATRVDAVVLPHHVSTASQQHSYSNLKLIILNPEARLTCGGAQAELNNY